MTSELVTLLEGIEVGRVRRDKRGQLTFAYDQAWRDAPDAYPVSLSMPLAAKEHGSAAVDAFLWGLLPDNEFVLQRWAKKYQVSARNAFALLSHVGTDCAGAIQFTPVERLDALRSGSDDKVEWLDERDIAERLRLLREDHAAWRLPRDTGQFSLAGAQPKTALLLEQHRWGVPSGRIPTTHILKPPTGHFDGHAENEHICLMVARTLGLPAASSQVMKFEKEIAIVVKRYDRQRSGNDILRVHQEDVCQALAVMPMKKYQNEGGPGIREVTELLNAQSSERKEDVGTFLGAIGFNWLIAGTDAHAKNYSLLISGGPRVRLAPLYDLASILPYEEFDLRKVKLAMKIGGEYELLKIGLRQWQKLAQEIRVDVDAVIDWLNATTQQLPDAVSQATERARKDGLKNAIIDRLAAGLINRAKECKRLLAAAG